MRRLAGGAMLLATLAAVPVASHAGLMDYFNGVRVGKPLPRHDMVYLDAGPDAGARLRLLDFWATWCAPCRESIPRLNALHKRHAANGLAVIGVTRESADVVRPFLGKVAIDYPIALDRQPALHDALGIKGLPYAVLVSAAGVIVWRGQPDEITDALIESFLKPKGSS